MRYRIGLMLSEADENIISVNAENNVFVKCRGGIHGIPLFVLCGSFRNVMDAVM